MTAALAAKKKRRRKPQATDSHRPHWSLDKVVCWLQVHGIPEASLLDATATRLGIDVRTLGSLVTNLRLAPTVDVALSLTASAVALSDRPRPPGSPPTVRFAAPDEVRLAYGRLGPSQQHYVRRMSKVTA
jgi:hypothetical protein